MPSIDEPEWLAGNLVLRGFFTETLQGLAHCCRIYLSPARALPLYWNDCVHQSQADKAEIVCASL